MPFNLITLLTLMCALFSVKAQLKRQNYLTLSTAKPSESKLPKLFEIKKYAYYAATAGCSDLQLTNWSCKSCLEANRNGTHFIRSFNNDWFGTWSTLSANNQDRKLVLSFRGTENYTNKLFNLFFITSNLFDSRFGKVHSGFKWLMRSMKPQFTRTVKDLLESENYRGYKLVVTGHSMGGALALLATLDLKFTLGLGWDQLELFTYGQPRTGDETFKDNFKKTPLVAVRGVNARDIVPTLLKGGMFKGYSHVGNEYFIDSSLKSEGRYCGVAEDYLCSAGGDENLFEEKAHLEFFETRFGPKNAC